MIRVQTMPIITYAIIKSMKIWSDADPPGLRMDRNQSGDTGAKISHQKINGPLAVILQT